jgi:hypothetical protein
LDYMKSKGKGKEDILEIMEMMNGKGKWSSISQSCLLFRSPGRFPPSLAWDRPRLHLGLRKPRALSAEILWDLCLCNSQGAQFFEISPSYEIYFSEYLLFKVFHEVLSPFLRFLRFLRNVSLYRRRETFRSRWFSTFLFNVYFELDFNILFRILELRIFVVVESLSFETSVNPCALMAAQHFGWSAFMPHLQRRSEKTRFWSYSKHKHTETLEREFASHNWHSDLRFLTQPSRVSRVCWIVNSFRGCHQSDSRYFAVDQVCFSGLRSP